MGKQVDKNDFWFIENNPITKVGVYPYLGKQISQDCEPDKIYYVLRPKEELFRKETLDSLRLIPLIDGHTMIGKDFTAPEDKGLDGTLGDNVSHDTDTIYNDLKIISNKMKEEIQNGKKELSLGYFCRYDKQPGTYKGQRYDYVQRDIIANHLALVDKGRMGADVRVYDSKNIPEGEAFAMDSIDISLDKEFNENDVNRDKNGRFATKGSSGEGGENEGNKEKGKENNSSSKKPLYSIKNENVQMSGGTEKDVINIVNDFIEGHGEGKKVDNIDDALEIGKKYNLFFVKHNTKKDWINYDAGRKFAPMIRDNKLLGEVLHYIEQLPIAEDMALDDEDIEWITVSGTHVPIKKGATAEQKTKTIENFFKMKRVNNKEDVDIFENEEKRKKFEELNAELHGKKQSSSSKAEPENLTEEQKESAKEVFKRVYGGNNTPFQEKKWNELYKDYYNNMSNKSIHQLYEDLKNGKFDYKDYGENSFVREEIFGRIADAEGVKYNDIYEMWLKSGEESEPKGKETKKNKIPEDAVYQNAKKRLDNLIKGDANKEKAMKELVKIRKSIPENNYAKREQAERDIAKKYKIDEQDVIKMRPFADVVYGQDSMEYKTIQGEGKMADKKEKVAIDEDKRKLIDEIGGILKDAGLDDELIRTVIGKAENIAYNKSEAGDDGEEVEEEVIEEENEEKDKKPAKDKCGKDEEKDEDKEEEEKKKVVKAFAQKEKLGKEVEDALGTFDHSEMTELEIAKYACDKLDLQVEKGQEISAVKGYLKGLAKAPKTTFGYKTVAADSGIQKEDAEFEKFVNKGE